MSKHDTFLRQWAMVRMVPRHPHKIDTRTIRENLVEQGFETSTRTIQRDLISLSSLFPLDWDDRNKPYGWSWAQDSHVLDIPGMTPVAAVAFRLAESYLTPLLPKATLTYLRPHFQRAQEVLKTSTQSGYRWWTSKVRTVPRGLELMPATILRDVQDTVYQALFEGRHVHLDYIPRGRNTAVEYDVNPLGLVFRQGIVYLVATLRDHDGIRQLALHRMRRATLTETRAITPAGFDLGTYIDEGAFGYPVSPKPITLRLCFATDVAHHLLETPMSDDQKMSPHPSGGMEVRATVNDTAELRWWLLGFGDQVEVLAPNRLRDEFQQIANNLYRRYRQ